MPKIILVHGADDWVGLYVDGQLVAQDHRLDGQDVLEALDLNFKVIWYDNLPDHPNPADFDMLEPYGYQMPFVFPDEWKKYL